MKTKLSFYAGGKEFEPVAYIEDVAAYEAACKASTDEKGYVANSKVLQAQADFVVAVLRRTTSKPVNLTLTVTQVYEGFEKLWEAIRTWEAPQSPLESPGR